MEITNCDETNPVKIRKYLIGKIGIEVSIDAIKEIQKALQIKVFKFYCGDYHYAFSGETEEQAKECLEETIGQVQIDKVEEIPESEWDEKLINIWEDNDHDNEPYQVSIRECLENTPTLIFTNDTID